LTVSTLLNRSAELGILVRPRVEMLVRGLMQQTVMTAGKDSRKLGMQTLLALLSLCPQHPSEGSSEVSGEEDRFADEAGADVRDLAVEELVSSVAKIKGMQNSASQQLGSSGQAVRVASRAEEIADECIKPLLPLLASPMAGGAAPAQRLLRLIDALPEAVVSRAAVAIAGPLIRAYSTHLRSRADARATTLLALKTLTSRAPAPVKVFVPQLLSTYFRGLGDVEARVRSRAVAAIDGLLPSLSRAEGILSSFSTLLHSSSMPSSHLLLSLRNTLEHFGHGLDDSTTNAMRHSQVASRICEMRTILEDLAPSLQGEEADLARKCEDLLTQTQQSHG